MYVVVIKKNFYAPSGRAIFFLMLVTFDVGSYRTNYLLELILYLTVNFFIKQRAPAEPWVLTNPTFLFMHHSSRESVAVMVITIDRTPSLASHCWGLFYFAHLKLQEWKHKRRKLILVRTPAFGTRTKHTAMADFYGYPVNASRKGRLQ